MTAGKTYDPLSLHVEKGDKENVTDRLPRMPLAYALLVKLLQAPFELGYRFPFRACYWFVKVRSAYADEDATRCLKLVEIGDRLLKATR